MKIYIFFLIICLGVFNDVKAQTKPQSKIQLHVITASGVRLREKPNTNSSTLATIPFGDSLTTDSMNSLSDLQEQKSALVIEIENIAGYWQKANYKGKKGYVFSGFVSHIFKPETIKNEYVFLNLEANCTAAVIANTNDYNWFAMLKIGDKTQLQAISKPNYAVEGVYLITNATVKGDCRHIIGVRKTEKMRLQTNLFESVWARPKDEIENMNYVLNEKKPNFSFKNSDYSLKLHNTQKDSASNTTTLDLYTKNAQKTQNLSPNLYLFSAEVLWYGDIDNDEKLDIILYLNGEQYQSVLLFLSSKAEKGQFLKLVGSVIYACC